MKTRAYVFLGLVLFTLAAAGMPFQRNDVAQLIPVEALVVSVEEGAFLLDGGDCNGRGKTWEEAWKDLKESADGSVFLSTAEYVVLVGGAAEALQKVVWNEELRPAAELYVGLGETMNPKKIAKYLSAHPVGMPIYRAKAACLENNNIHLPVLIATEEGMRLYGADDR